MSNSLSLYHFSGFDMEWSYYTDAGRKAASCALCGVRCADWERPPNARTKKLPYDFNDTYDGKVILSERAKDFFDSRWPGQMKTRQIFDNAWEAEPARVLVVSNQDEITLFSSEYGIGDNIACPECGLYYCQTFKDYQFRFANPDTIDEGGIFCTDISFGHAFRGPLWLAGTEAAFAISAKFREVHLRPFEEDGDGNWLFGLDKAFRADPEPNAVEPTYPDFLE